MTAAGQHQCPECGARVRAYPVGDGSAVEIARHPDAGGHPGDICEGTGEIVNIGDVEIDG